MSFFGGFSLAKITNGLFRLLINHFKLLFLDLDQVKDAQTYRINRDQLLHEFRLAKADKLTTSTSLHHGYLLPLFVLLWMFIDTAASLYHNDFHYSYKEMPRFWPHRIMPEELWQTTDYVVLLGAYYMPPTVYTLLLFDKMLDRRFVMYLFRESNRPIELIQNGQMLSSEVVQKIYSYRRVAKLILFIGVLISDSTFFPFIGWCFLRHWDNSPYDYCLFIGTMVFLFYALYTNIFVLYYFCITSRYVRIKQNSKMSQQRKLAQLLVQKIATQANYKINQNKNLWIAFKRLNVDVSALYEEIRGLNVFWSKYLTCYFIFYITEICLFAYTFFFAKLDLGIKKHLFSIIGSQITVLLLFVTWQCSKIVYYNCKMHRQAQQMALQFKHIYKFSIGDIFKLDLMAANFKNIEEIAFRLTVGYAINSKMFQMIFTYISLCFMMIFKNLN